MDIGVDSGRSGSALGSPLYAHAWLHTWALTALLVMLIITVFVLPALIPSGDLYDVARDVFVTLTLITGFVSVARHRVSSYTLALLCVAAITTRWMEWLVPGSMLVPVRQIATLLAVGLLAAIVAKDVFTAGKVTVDRIMGAIVLYLLLGIAFAVAYDSLAMHIPHAFAGAFEGVPGFERWTYFSFVTLTTVGYGDITPVATVARSIATFEAFVGQLYPVVILARLVSLQITPPSES
jgi:hypothetical protein